MGNVIFVLAVVGFWAIVFFLVVFLIRISMGAHSDEQGASDMSQEQYEGQDNSAALT